ncbi:MAG: hypothetical protein COT85_06900 [Chlamydiae bacterium CG10_big_fil_rev_8_21_14_0_10_42_34]|nr:MAG: hypothetical protein COT85_06900 [Chlamydiae bacterium CG10_big_fil_rev_8_21_14_0_10_42_34]
MTRKITIENKEWEKGENRFKYCEALEDGNILFFPTTPFSFPKEEIDFLLTQRQSGSSSRKNIAYKPCLDQVTNHGSNDLASTLRLKEILRDYSLRATEFLTKLLQPYANDWKLDYASFRPFQEKGRKLRVRARNDLLHVDAFPTRPMHGSRILRFFTNINPSDSRHWITSSEFKELAKEFYQIVSIPKSVNYSLAAKLGRKMKRFLKSSGLKKALRSPYDTFMMNMHNFLKESSAFQESCHKDHWEFPPGSCWAVFTDQVSHAALAGQYALEQTFLVPQRALLYPEKSPLSILEQLSGKNLIDQQFLRELFPIHTHHSVSNG